jgi:hypothetical protein
MNQFSKIYFSKRTTKNKDGKTISNKMDNLFVQSIKDRKNIIFETTGQNFNDYNPIVWILKMLKEAKEDNKNSSPYLITIIYPVVDEKIIFNRINGRAKSQLERDPPFYRTVKKDDLKKNIENCKLNFYIYLVPMILYLGEIHKIVIFNNDK